MGKTAARQSPISSLSRLAGGQILRIRHLINDGRPEILIESGWSRSLGIGPVRNRTRSYQYTLEMTFFWPIRQDIMRATVWSYGKKVRSASRVGIFAI